MLRGGLLAPLLGASPWHVQAQQPQAAPPAELQQVTVTAQRIESTVEKTPVSVGVIDADEINRKGIRQLNDIVGVIAGVSVPNGYSNMPQAVGIRGVGVSQPAMSQAVGIYVDDVPLVRGYATALWDLPDIERIEVLRGPQGTLYGQNSSAGAVKIVSIDPGSTSAAWVEGSLGNHGAREFRAYGNGAIVPGTLAASLALSRRTNDGFGWNATLDEHVNKLDATQFRTKFKLTLTPAITALLAIDGLLDRSDTNTTNFPLNDPHSAPRVTFTSGDAGAFERRAGGVSLKLEDRMEDDLVARSITAFRAYKDDPTVADWGGLAVQRYTFSQTVKQGAFSQEIQLQRQRTDLSWIVGAMLVRDTFEFDRLVTTTPLAAPAPVHNEAQTQLQTVDLGMYGQATYALENHTNLTAGLRAYRTRQVGENQFWITDAEQQRTANVYSAPDLSTTRTGWLPRLGIDHQWNTQTFVYASVARGAKFGGFNRAAQSELSAQVASNPEKVTTYEIGSKGRYANGRFTANVTGFFNDYRDYLASLNNTTINGVLVTDAVLVNAGRAKTFGLDLELAAKLTDQTDWTLSSEVLRSRFESFANPTGAAATNYVGNELPNAPHFTAGSSLRHAVRLERGDEVSAEASVQLLASSFNDVSNTDALKTPKQVYFNLSASYVTPERHWTLSARVRNVFDRTYVLVRNVIPPLGVNAGYYNAPRTLLFTARYDY